MTQITFTNGTTVICHHAVPEIRSVRSLAYPSQMIDKCFVTLHFTVNRVKEYEAKEIARIEGINLAKLI